MMLIILLRQQVHQCLSFHVSSAGQHQKKNRALSPAPYLSLSLSLSHTHTLTHTHTHTYTRSHTHTHTANLMSAQTSPVRLRLQDVEVRYSWGFSRYVSIMKLRYARYLKHTHTHT